MRLLRGVAIALPQSAAGGDAITLAQVLGIASGMTAFFAILLGVFRVGKLTQQLAAIEEYKLQLATQVQALLEQRLKPLEEDLRNRHAQIARQTRSTDVSG